MAAPPSPTITGRAVVSPASTAASVVQPSIRSPRTTRVLTEGASVSQSAATATLYGAVTFAPMNPSAGRPRTASARRAGGVGNGTYVQSRPSAANAALCIRGERECSTGQPMMPTSRVFPLISLTAGVCGARRVEHISTAPPTTPKGSPRSLWSAYRPRSHECGTRRRHEIEPTPHPSPLAIALSQQPKPYSHFLRKNSDSLAVKKWWIPSGLRTKKR